MDKCVGVLAAVGDVKAACPLLPSSGVYGTMDGALFAIILFSVISFFSCSTPFGLLSFHPSLFLLFAYFTCFTE